MALLVLSCAPWGCDRDSGKSADGTAEKQGSLAGALAEARARAPKSSDPLEIQAQALVRSLSRARRQMIMTTEGEAERLPGEVLRLVKMGRLVIPIIEPALSSEVPDTRYFAYEVLVEVADARELDQFMAGLADSDLGVARLASQAIGKYRNLDTVPLLFQALQEGRIQQVRWGQVLKPPKEFDRELVPYLVGRLMDANQELRLSASIALSQITGKDFGFDPSSDEETRRRAVMRWEAWWTQGGRDEPPPPAREPGTGISKVEPRA